MQSVSTASGAPGPPAKPPRSAMTMRDLLGAVVLLALVLVVTAALSRLTGAGRAVAAAP